MVEENLSDYQTIKVDGGGGKPHYYWQNFIKIINKFSILQFKTSKALSSKGAILIEFAFCLPVMIVLIYYIYDLNKLKRYYSKTEFVAQQMASMIQNISQNRENKAITARDLKYIFSAAWLSMYTGTSMFYQGHGYLLAHKPWTVIYYVKGLAEGKASCIWRFNPNYPENKETSPSNLSHATHAPGSSIVPPVNFSTNVSPKVIYPSLEIQEGEVKIIIEGYLLGGSKYTPDINGKTIPAKKAFGFYLINPKSLGHYNYETYFHSVVIFTPRPGLFSETAPR